MLLPPGEEMPAASISLATLSAKCSPGPDMELSIRQHECLEFSAAVSVAPVLRGGLKDPVTCTCKALGTGAVTQ